MESVTCPQSSGERDIVQSLVPYAPFSSALAREVDVGEVGGRVGIGGGEPFQRSEDLMVLAGFQRGRSIGFDLLDHYS